MLPLWFWRFKDRCYIKTARNYVQHRKKGFEDDSSTHSILSVGFVCYFSFFFFLHVPPPHYWCWLAVSRSNNMAEWFSKNTVVAVRLFRGVTLEEADSPRHRHWWIWWRALAHTGPLTDTSCGGGVSSFLSVCVVPGESSAGCRSDRESFSRDTGLSSLQDTNRKPTVTN